MARIFFIACMLVTCVSAVTALETSSPGPSPSPSPSGDCSEVTYNLADCFDFLTKGSKFMKPSSSCCSGFESVVTTNVHCVCEAIRSSYDLGLNLNVTRAISISSLCGISAPLVTTCDMTPPSPPKKSPSPSPLPPKQSPTPSPFNPPAPAPSASAPSLAPNNGAAAYSSAAASITAVILGSMLVAVSLSS